MTTLIIARHGNTFGPDDTVTYVGARTDLFLVEKGIEQAKAIGLYLKNNDLIPDVVYASTLRRAQETAKIAIKASGVTNPVYTLDIFNEIDYGPDENKTKEEIIARVGADALKQWEENSIPPPGWDVHPQKIIGAWEGFANQITTHDDNETVLVVTSNGVARFAPYLTGDFMAFRQQYDLKIATGAYGHLHRHPSQTTWSVVTWNQQPEHLLKT